MNANTKHDTHLQVAQRVRARGMSAAIGAAFLLYFGFARLIEPQATDLFSSSNLILYHTARWGGVLMAIVALWLWSGHVVALLADGVTATLIGVLLVVTGLGMGVGGGDMFQTLINFFCGYMFFSSGVQNGRDYFRLTNRTGTPDLAGVQTHLARRVEPQPATPIAQPERVSQDHQRQVDSVETPVAQPEAVVEPEPSPPPPGGYLASFAKKDPDEDS